MYKKIKTNKNTVKKQQSARRTNRKIVGIFFFDYFIKFPFINKKTNNNTIAFPLMVLKKKILIKCSYLS